MAKITTLFGITPVNPATANFDDYFDVLLDDNGRFVAESKNTYHHDEDDPECRIKPFDYKLAIEACDWSEFGGDDDNKFDIDLYIVPTNESMHPDALQSCLNYSGLDNIDDLNAYDKICDGCVAQLAHETIEYDGETEAYRLTERDEFNDALSLLPLVAESINSMRGFYLDGVWNGIGSTGWDKIEAFLTGKSFVDLTMARWKH